MGVIVALVVFIFILVLAISSSDKKPELEPKRFKEISKKGQQEYRYKTSGIKYFELRGMYYIDENEPERFCGLIKTQQNKHDKYALGVFNSTGKRIAWIPKGNRRLHNAILGYGGTRFCWGELYLTKEGYWRGFVYVPIGIPEDDFTYLEKYVKNQFTLKSIKSKELNSSDLILRYVDSVNKNLHLYEKVKHYSILNWYSMDTTYFNNLIEGLYEREDWSSLILFQEIMKLEELLTKKTYKRYKALFQIAKSKLMEE